MIQMIKSKIKVRGTVFSQELPPFPVGFPPLAAGKK